MSLLRYFSPSSSLPTCTSGSVPSLPPKAVCEANMRVESLSMQTDEDGSAPKHAKITKAWAKSLLSRMGFVKRKGSTSAKLPVSEFEKRKEQYLLDIRTKVIMNDIPPCLVINWDQTAIHLVPVSGWTMNRQEKKSISIAGFDDKREITVVLAVMIPGEYLPPQILYQSKTERFHPAIEFPPEWDMWHTENHWSNEVTMVRYAKKNPASICQE